MYSDPSSHGLGSDAPLTGAHRVDRVSACAPVSVNDPSTTTREEVVVVAARARPAGHPCGMLRTYCCSLVHRPRVLGAIWSPLILFNTIKNVFVRVLDLFIEKHKYFNFSLRNYSQSNENQFMKLFYSFVEIFHIHLK
jgi:hypothetical protein